VLRWCGIVGAGDAQIQADGAEQQPASEQMQASGRLATLSAKDRRPSGNRQKPTHSVLQTSPHLWRLLLVPDRLGPSEVRIHINSTNIRRRSSGQVDRAVQTEGRAAAAAQVFHTRPLSQWRNSRVSVNDQCKSSALQILYRHKIPPHVPNPVFHPCDSRFSCEESFSVTCMYVVTESCIFVSRKLVLVTAMSHLCLVQAIGSMSIPCLKFWPF
jgi:hypothetical protein